MAHPYVAERRETLWILGAVGVLGAPYLATASMALGFGVLIVVALGVQLGGRELRQIEAIYRED